MSINIELNTSQVRQNPYSAYREVRRLGSAVYDSSRKKWYVGRYEDVAQVLRNHKVFSNKVTGVESTLLGADGSLHARSRRIVSPAFVVERINSMRSSLRLLVCELSGSLLRKSECELIEDYASLVPATGIAWMLGIDDKYVRDIRRWSTAILDSTGARRLERNGVESNKSKYDKHVVTWLKNITRKLKNTKKNYRESESEMPGGNNETMLILGECRDFLIDHFNYAKKKSTGGWLIDYLVNCDARLSNDELLDICYLMIVAGTETTTDLIGNSALVLAGQPVIQEYIRNNPELLPAFIEEVLRYDSPVQRRPRVAAQPARIGDTQLPEGAQVELLIGSANHDPYQFPDAHLFRLDRAQNKHLSFGMGPHFCLGSELARLEASIALDALIRDLPKMVLSCHKEEIRYPSNLSRRGPVALHVRFK